MPPNDAAGVISSRSDYEKNPTDQYKYWQTELNSAFKRLRSWHKQGTKIERLYVDDRVVMGGLDTSDSGTSGGKFKLNLFHSNTKTIQDMLFGKLPRIDVSRLDTTGNDDVARVAAEMLERILRLDLENNGEAHSEIFKAGLSDRLLPGLGCARVRYDVKTKAAKTALRAVSEDVSDEPPQEMASEACLFDYYYWADVAWGWCRGYSDMPWQGFRSYLTKDEAKERFGKEIADGLTYKRRDVNPDKEGINDPDMASAWQKAEIWEIWDKFSKKVIWVSLGYDKVLDTRKDPLQLKNFFPAPPFLIANPTNALYKPTPDYHLAQDLYNEIDVLQTRVAILTEAVKVVGVYDASAEGIQRMFNEGVDNTLIPVDNWALFAEKGGIQGQIDWVPLAEVVGALDKLRELRDDSIGLLQQTTGMADIMRGELGNQYEGVGQTEIKAKFASSRLQALSEDFAKWVTNLQKLKAEIICKHFDPMTIAKMANMQFSPDADKVPEAITLLKSPNMVRLRIEVKSETMAQEDYARLQQERGAYLNGLSTFIQSASPLIQQDPRSTPFLLEMLKWGMAGFKGSSDIEGVLDQAIETMKQPQQQEQKPDPAEQAAQLQLKIEEMRAQGKQQAEQLKAQTTMQIRQQDMQMDVQTRQQEHRMEMEKAQFEAYNEMQVIAAKMDADVRTELLTSQINAQQQQMGQEGEILKAIELAKLDIVKMREGKQFDMQIKAMEKSFDAAENQKDRQSSDNSGDDT